MKPKSPLSEELYKIMCEDGYPEPFCDLVTKNLNTDFTAQRMIGYLSHYDHLPEGEIVDEMLAILSDRNRIMQHKEMIRTNEAWNEMMQQDIFK
ncbi:MAG: hypothetical protein K5776_07260 [Lachnospiraceae bacterium]|nr:hypothetical protein [Lachnospiraceae bacterium]